ncbi:MAG: hypothetical protein ABIA63_02820 [bacterium]
MKSDAGWVFWQIKNSFLKNMDNCRKFCFVLFGFCFLSSADQFKKSNLIEQSQGPTPQSIFSAGGKFYIKQDHDNQFELRNTFTGDIIFYSIHSQGTRYFQDKPDQQLFTFSMDERYLCVENYFIRHKAPWRLFLEIWDINQGKVVMKTFDLSKAPLQPFKIDYSMRTVIEGIKQRNIHASYNKMQRTFFTRDSRYLITLYPQMRIWRIPDFNEIYGDFNLFGIRKQQDGYVCSNLSRPRILNNNGRVLLPLSSGRFRVYSDFFGAGSGSYFDFFPGVTQYEKYDISPKGDLIIISGNNNTQLWKPYQPVPFRTYDYGGAVFAGSGNRLYLDKGVWLQEPDFFYEKGNLPLYRGDFIYAENGSFGFETDRRDGKLKIYNLEDDNIVQTVALKNHEELYFVAANGNVFIVKNKVTGNYAVYGL